jgi:hypothetical protein
MDIVHLTLQCAHSDPHTRLGTGSRPCGVDARVSRSNGGWQRHVGYCGNEDEHSFGAGMRWRWNNRDHRTGAIPQVAGRERRSHSLGSLAVTHNFERRPGCRRSRPDSGHG